MAAMRNVIRWAGFTAGTALVGLAIAFGLLFLGRLYGAMQSPAFVFGVLVVYSSCVAIAAINYASKLEDERAQEAEIGGTLRLPSRRRRRGRDPE